MEKPGGGCGPLFYCRGRKEVSNAMLWKRCVLIAFSALLMACDDSNSSGSGPLEFREEFSGALSNDEERPVLFRFDQHLSELGYNEYAEACNACSDVPPYDSSRTYLAVVNGSTGCAPVISLDAVDRVLINGMEYDHAHITKADLIGCACPDVVHPVRVTVYSWPGGGSILLHESHGEQECGA